EHSPDFPPDVPDAAREGTRRNMLGEALLDAERNPQIVLRAVRLESAGEAGGEARAVLARVQTTVRGEQRTISVPVRYQFTAGALIASGEAPLRQSDLGLTPFSALLGALQVQDEMRVRFRIVARAAGSPPGAQP
ncbi:MAG: YceI family protein, partial [Gammaproteobacteria bacterium]